MSKDEVGLHLDVASEKREAAKELLKSGFLRDAGSRAYYAMYHAAYALARTRDHAPKTHRGLLALVSKEFMGAEGLSAELLAGLRRAQSVRELGDYEALFAPDEETVENLIKSAAAFVDRVRELTA